MYLMKYSLVYAKRKSQAFACLINAKHNDQMDIVSTRRNKLRLWFSDKSIPESEKSYISQLINGKASFGEKAARRLEDTYRMPKWYLDNDEQQPSTNIASTTLGTRRIPLISYVQAGHMTEAIDPYTIGNSEEWLLTDLDLAMNAFALKIKGDSMLPEFREGDTVIIDPSVQPLPGDYVVAKNCENEATFKKYRPRGINERGEQVFELVPLNDDYPSMRSDLVNITIIGTMVEHRRYRKR